MSKSGVPAGFFFNQDTQQLQRIGARSKPQGSKAEQALRLAKRNKRKIGQTHEVVALNTAITSAALNATPTVLFLPLSPSGVGNSLKVYSVQVKGVFKINLASALIDDYRMDLVLDRMPDKAVVTTLLYLGTATPTNFEYKNFQEKGRFKILKTWRGHLLNDVGGVNHAEVNYYRRLNYMAVSASANTFGSAQLIKNSLFLVRWTTATANQPTFQGNVRMITEDEQ